MGFAKNNRVFSMFLFLLIYLPHLFNVAFFVQANIHSSSELTLSNKNAVVVNTNFVPKKGTSNDINEWILSYELSNYHHSSSSKTTSLQVKSIFIDDFFPLIYLGEKQQVEVTFPTTKIAKLVSNNLNDFYWLEISGTDNVLFSSDAVITNTTAINYREPELTLNETIDTDQHLYNLSWESNLDQNYAWILLPIIDIYAIDNLKAPIYQFSLADKNHITYKFPEYVEAIFDWCWIDGQDLTFSYLKPDKTFGVDKVNIDALSITTIPPQFTPPNINLVTNYYRKQQEIIFSILISDPQHRMIASGPIDLKMTVATCYKNLLTSSGEKVDQIELFGSDFTFVGGNVFQATVKTYNLTSLDPSLIWIEDEIENIYWHSGILSDHEETYIKEFNSISGISNFKQKQYADEKPLNLIIRTTFSNDKKRLIFTLEGIEFPYLFNYQINLKVYDFRGELANYRFDVEHNYYALDLKPLDKPLYPNSNLNDYFYLELNIGDNNFYEYNDEYGFLKTTKAVLNETINLEGALTNTDANRELLNYEDYIGGRLYFLIIFVSVILITFLILIIIFATNKLSKIT